MNHPVTALRQGACALVACVATLGGTFAPPTFAQLVNSSLPIEMEADSTGADARTGKVTFTNISIRQGPLSIVADQAESSTLDFNDSTWVFRGNVKLDAPQSSLNASRMTLNFADKRIQRALLTGAPLSYTDKLDNGTRVVAEQADVRFARNSISTVELSGSPIELSRAATDTGKRTEGRANVISYDAASSNLQLSGDAELGEGVNRITGNQITYNLTTRQILAAANELGEGKVHITINPDSGDTTIEGGTSDDNTAGNDGEENSATDNATDSSTENPNDNNSQ